MKIVDLIDTLQRVENDFDPGTEVLLYPPFSDPDEDRDKEWAKGSTAAGFVLLYPYG